MRKKLISLILGLIITASLVIGCNRNAGQPSGTKDDPNRNTSGPATSGERLFPDLPDKTFGGKEYRMYVSDVFGYRAWEDLFVEESGSEPISVAVFNRNEIIKEKYDIKISMVVDEYLKYEQNIATNIKTDEDFADVLVSLGDNICRLYTQDVFYDLRSVPYLDFTMPWWDSGAVEAFTLGGYMPYGISDMTVNDIGVTGAVFFNKVLAVDLKLGDLYRLVKDDEWTFAKMAELGKKAELDINEIGVPDEEDRYGIMGDDGMVYQFFAAGGAKYVTKNAGGMPELSFYTERNVSMIKYFLEDILFDERLTFHGSGAPGTDSLRTDKMFMKDQALFLMRPIKTADQLRGNMESDYGILPLPKYDKSQKDYCCPVQCYGGSVISVPLNIRDLEFAGIVLEALSAESRYTVVPAFYDIVLTKKGTRDDESKEMLDIILASRVYDVAVFYDFANFPNSFIFVTGKQIAYSGIKQTSDVTSFYRERENKLLKALEDLEKTIEEWNS
mgnify:FL=1